MVLNFFTLHRHLSSVHFNRVLHLVSEPESTRVPNTNFSRAGQFVGNQSNDVTSESEYGTGASGSDQVFVSAEDGNDTEDTGSESNDTRDFDVDMQAVQQQQVHSQ